jgi:outer membrane protein assembly factor BamB
MLRRSLTAVLAVAVLSALPAAAAAANGHASSRAVCPGAPIGAAHCHALVVTDAHGNPDATTAPTGLAPATIRSVYGFPTGTAAGAGETIAIVDAYDDPTAESDLGTFSSQYGLPACTTGNGCFAKVDQTGGTSYPGSDQGWALEISLDVQWAHAIAPGARILLVEASSNSFADLFAAEDYAKQHAQYVSNSWGGSEFAGETSYDAHFAQAGVSFFVSAGDSGLPAQYPSASPNVVSVGGTTLTFAADGSLQSETGWSSGGGGCSAYETAAPAQSGFPQYGQAGCGGRRATPDVSLDADPSSGVAVYDSTPYYGQAGWFTVGGTSASAPMWAARSADTGGVVDAAYVYGDGITYRDITSGDNGAPCLVGYDLCTGRGSWIASAAAGVSIGSFAPSSGPPGTSVLIRGSGFTGATAVSFAGTSASFSVGSDTSITATVPAGAASGTISVTAPGGTAASATPFTVAAPEADVAVAYQVGVDHRGFQTDAALAPPLARRWLATFPNPTSYPLIAAGKVFVTASAAPSGGTTLYALDQGTGARVWSASIPGTYAFSAAAYDGGQVFVVNSDGLLQAFAADTGAPAWSNQLPGQWMFTSPPTAGNGVVYVGGAGSGGTVYAVDERSGGLIATQPVANGDHSSPALAGGGVFVSYACDQAYGFAQTSLSPLWHYATGCEGGGGKTVVAAGGYVFTRDASEGNLILGAGDGGLVGSWTPAGTSALAPAADSTTLYTLTFPTGGAVLTAQALAGNSTRWTFTGDGQLDTAPIVVSTPAGEYVIEGSASGTLYALEAATGAPVWSTSVGAAIPRPDEQNAVQLTGLAAGQGLLVVPAGNGLAAYAAASAPVVSSFSPSSGPAGTSVTLAGSGFTGTTAVAFGGAPAAFSVLDDGHLTATVPAGATSGPISVTTPAGTGTSSGSFTVTVPDFALAATPSSQSVVAGKAVAYTVTVTPSGGFAGSVSLSASGLPAGVTASFSPATTTSTSTLTVQTARSAKSGTATLTITGTSGSLVHSTTVTLQVRKK